MDDYQRIEKAIAYIQKNFSKQPRLEQVAKQVHLSPFHFQRIFQDWAGVSPKKFLQYVSLQHAKKCLKQNASLLDVSFDTGLSGTSRLHDLFVTLEGMTPGEFKNDGEKLSIHYRFAKTLFGEVLIASTQKGICHLAFVDNQNSALKNLRGQFSKAKFLEKNDDLQNQALKIFEQHPRNIERIKLHLKGTPFQLKVWQSLLQIPQGHLESYADIAQSIKSANAVRAVGTAIGKNPIAYLIPCHRVIQSTGLFGQYRWGETKKAALIGWEASQVFGRDE